MRVRFWNRRCRSSDLHDAHAAQLALSGDNPGLALVSRALDTIENRREQMALKATVCGAAALGLILISVQSLLLTVSEIPLGPKICGMTAVISGGWALVQSANIVKRLPFRGRRVRRSRSTHLLHFGVLARTSASDLKERMVRLTADDQLNEYIAQAKSLASNLESRYRSLGQAFVGLAFGAVFLVCGVGWATVVGVLDTVGGSENVAPGVQSVIPDEPVPSSGALPIESTTGTADENDQSAAATIERK